MAAGKRKWRLKTNARHLLTCIWSVSIDVEAKVEEELRVVEGHLQLLAVLPKTKQKPWSVSMAAPGSLCHRREGGAGSPRSDERVTVLVKLLQLKGFHGF